MRNYISYIFVTKKKKGTMDKDNGKNLGMTIFHLLVYVIPCFVSMYINMFLL